VLRVRAQRALRTTVLRRPSRSRRRLAQASIGLFGLGGLFAGAIGTGGPAAAEGGCENLPEYSALASATGARTDVALQGQLVPGADAALPAAQALLDSVEGSRAFAGAPYSSAASDNVGAGSGAPGGIPGIGPALGPALAPFFVPNSVPVFAVSSHPTTPSASKPVPGGNIEAKSAAQSSEARAVLGSASEQSAIAATNSTGKVVCTAESSLEAVAANATSGINIANTLRISSVQSHAKVVVDQDGKRTLEGSMSIDGAAVNGQAVAITEKGIVVGTAATPLPDTVTPALKAAGIEVQYVTSEKDESTGSVMSPGLVVRLTQTVPSLGPVTYTYSFGRALARGGLKPGDATFSGDDLGLEDFSSFDGGSTFTDAVSADVAPLPDTGGTGSTAKPSGGSGEASVPTARIADWSIAPGYSAMGVGALLLLVAWVGLEKMAVRFRWR
jgi:hypothetical protein